MRLCLSILKYFSIANYTLLMTFSSFFSFCCRRGKKVSNVENTELFSKTDCNINQIENSKELVINNEQYIKDYQFLLPKKNDALPTLVLDLDNTLVYSKLEYSENYDFFVECADNGEIVYIFVKLRPYLDLFLEKLSKLYEIVIFTAAKKEYALKVMDKINSEGYIKYALFRESCSKIGDEYVKDLSLLGRDLSKTWIIDDFAGSFRLQPQNGLLIDPFYGCDNDICLYNFIQILENKYLA